MTKCAARGPRGAARTAAGRGRVNTSPKGRAVREQQDLSKRRRRRRSAGAVEDSGDGKLARQLSRANAVAHRDERHVAALLVLDRKVLDSTVHPPGLRRACSRRGAFGGRSLLTPVASPR